jgi:Beta-glucosidase-related glycosidases
MRFLKAIALVLLLSACAPFANQAANDQARRPTFIGIPASARTATAISQTDHDLESEVERLIADMTLEEKVGQLMVVAFLDDYASPAISALIQELHIGGVILVSANLRDPSQARDLIDQLQAQAKNSGAAIPLFTMLDQEGGIVVRATNGLTIWPSQMQQGASRDPEVVARAARGNAQELRAIGINMNLAPVLDVNNNPSNPVIGPRSFGADPNLVAELGLAAIEAYQAEGIVAVGKHFPGHGDTHVDSHYDLPVIDKARSEFERTELVPFGAAARAGIDAIMTAHIAVPHLSGDQASTLSHATLTATLRNYLGFDGIIITDDLEMQAISERYGSAEAALLAFRAGADLLLFRFDHQQARHGHQLLLAAVHAEPELQARLDQSLRRILRVKLRRGLFQERSQIGLEELASPERQQAAVEVARAGLTLVRNEGGLLPLDPNDPNPMLVLSPEPAQVARREIPIADPSTLSSAIAAKRPVTALNYSLDPSPQERVALLAAAQSAHTIIIGSYDAQLYSGQQALINELVASGKQLVVVGLRLPYELQHFSQVPVYLAAFDNRPASHRAIAEAIFGEHAPQGHLPVPIADLAPYGFGLLNYTQADRLRP